MRTVKADAAKAMVTLPADAKESPMEDGIISKKTLEMEPLPPPSVSTVSTPTFLEVSTEDGDELENEEERLNYFLSCFTEIKNEIEDSGGGTEDIERGWGCANHCVSNDDTSRQRGAQERKPSRMDAKRKQDNSESAGQRTPVCMENEHSDSSRLSFLDDEQVLKSLQSAMESGNRSRRASDNGIVSNRENTKVRNSYPNEENCPHRDSTIPLFFKFFKFAQTERLRKSHNRPYMILGLFSNLSDIRSDLEWAQDAAHRREAGKPYISWKDYFSKERKGLLSLPLFTSMTLVACIVLLIWAFHMNKWKIEPLRVNPLIGPSPQTLLKMGALQGRVLIEDRKWWLLVTPIFLHAGIAHLGLNAIFLVFVCRTIERNHGCFHTGFVFLASGMFGNLISALLQPGYILVGASGGIYGLIGACVGDILLNARFFFLVLEERAQEQSRVQELSQSVPTIDDHDSQSTRSWTLEAIQISDPDAIKWRRRRVRRLCHFSLFCDLVLNSLVGLLPFVDNFAHLGGLLFGFFISLSSLRLLSGSAFDYRRKEQKTSFGRWCHRMRVMTLRCGGLLAALSLTFVAILFFGQSDGLTTPCPNCRYVSCLSLPRPWAPNDPNNWWTCDGCGGVTAQVYPGSGIHHGFFVNVEIFCPQGNNIDVDVSERKYTSMNQVNALLPDLCRTFCDAG